MQIAGNTLARRRLVNHEITKRIISLHNQGYVVDFQIGRNRNIICNDEDPYPIFRDFTIKIIDLCFDQLSGSYKYLHAIETECGKKGLLLADEPLSPPVLEFRNADFAFLMQ